MRLVVLVSLLALAVPAGAALKTKDAEAVRVRVAGGAKMGVGLRPHSDGWRLRLEETGGGARAELIDVTPGTPARTLSVMVSGDELLLDHVRFHGGHVYHVMIRRGEKSIGSGFVYLYPAAPIKDLPRTREPAKMQFTPTETAADKTESNAPHPVAKSAL
jgi:hypothetical protein